MNYYKCEGVVNPGGYKIPVADITSSKQNTTWTKLTKASHFDVALVPNSSPPMVIGGHKRPLQQDATTDIQLRQYDITADIKMYNESKKSWEKVDSLSFARTGTGVAAIGNNAIVVIGGCTDANDFDASAITTVELGQAELLQ